MFPPLSGLIFFMAHHSFTMFLRYLWFYFTHFGSSLSVFFVSYGLEFVFTFLSFFFDGRALLIKEAASPAERPSFRLFKLENYFLTDRE
jgi:hypothetical protein